MVLVAGAALQAARAEPSDKPLATLLAEQAQGRWLIREEIRR